MICLVSGPFAEGLADDARARQRQAHRPGTNAARESAVRLFLAFCNKTNISYKRISYHHVCWYIEYLARHYKSPSSVSNAISSLRTFYTLAGLPTRPLNHLRVQLALRAVSVNMRHVPSPPGPASPAILKAALARLAGSHRPHAMRLAILLMYVGFLRQSSLVPPSVAKFDPTRHLTMQDVYPVEGGLHVNIKWTKTKQSSADATHIILPPTSDPLVCPVRAFKSYIAVAPAHHTPTAPLLRHPDGNTLTVPYVRRQWDQLLRRAAIQGPRVSLHSLRKGGANFTYNDCQANLNDVMTHGTWRSQAVRAYIAPAQAPTNSVYKALQRL